MGPFKPSDGVHSPLFGYLYLARNINSAQEIEREGERSNKIKEVNRFALGFYFLLLSKTKNSDKIK